MENKVSDLTFLKAFSGGKSEMMKMFINTFFNTADAALKEVNQHLETANWMDLRKVAHTLKPQLSYMGITTLAPVILQIEENADQQKNLDQMPALVDQLNTVTQQAIVELRAELPNL